MGLTLRTLFFPDSRLKCSFENGLTTVTDAAAMQDPRNIRPTRYIYYIYSVRNKNTPPPNQDILCILEKNVLSAAVSRNG